MFASLRLSHKVKSAVMAWRWVHKVPSKKWHVLVEQALKTERDEKFMLIIEESSKPEALEKHQLRKYSRHDSPFQKKLLKSSHELLEKNIYIY
jgi:hypothetical protein